ncbi:MAG TPA: response regulator transcription factor [Burkholderiales bacterium]|nr:response regulator transcription factor [Burkholderiales bacterium]
MAIPYDVFLVEDSPMLRKRLEAMLASVPGARVVGHAAGAQDAIRAILAAPPQAVVLDISLAEGNGFEVLRAVRERLPLLPFYVLTNFANEAYRAMAEKHGARGFFDKSNEIERLHSVLAAAAAAPA